MLVGGCVHDKHHVNNYVQIRKILSGAMGQSTALASSWSYEPLSGTIFIIHVLTLTHGYNAVRDHRTCILVQQSWYHVPV